jgi:GNAT superfamily N-acetyltransferase
MIRARPEDWPEIEAFLKPRAEYAMFPLNNVRFYGFDGDEPLSPRFWIGRSENGELTDVLSMTKKGMVMPYLPSGDFAAAAKVLSGRIAEGIIGPCDHARGLQAALSLENEPVILADDDPHFVLDLDDLEIPEGPGKLVPLSEADPETLIGWRIAYSIEAIEMTPERAEEEGRKAYHSYIERGSHRVLIVEGVPVATTGINARLPEIVQVGGVYTPPALRGRGFARRAVALHMAEARAEGATRATLFAGSDMAARAYEAIGFRRIGDWSIILFKEPVTLDV